MIEKLWAVVHAELGAKQMGITPECEDELRNMIDIGVSQIRASFPLTAVGQTSIDPAQLQLIQNNLRQFIQLMAQDAVKKGYPDLHEDTFFEARSKLCPGFWPFC